MANHQVHPKEFIVGAVVGSLLGSVAALLVAPKAGKRFRQDISDLCSDLSDRAQDTVNLVSRRGKSLAKNVGYQASGWREKVGLGEDGTSDFLVGGVVGGVLGAAIGLLLAPKSGSEFRQNLADTCSDMSEKTYEAVSGIGKKGKGAARVVNPTVNKWIEIAKDVIDGLSGHVQEVEDVAGKARKAARGDRLHDIMEWASIGYRVWQGLKEKR